jgi:outer membrane protein OmpA-like peptidoglycan-associated protein/tetratricopeptide (TPR) repeat protein
MKTIFSTLLIMLSYVAVGQSSRLSYAHKQYERLAYSFAVEAYEDVLERGVDSASIASRVSDSYYRIGNISKANEWYDFMETKSLLNKEELLRAALLKRQVGDYDKSLYLFVQYQEKYGENDIARSMIAEGEELVKLQTKSNNFNIDRVDINTTASEIGIAYFGDGKVLVASSSKQKVAVNQVYPWTGDHYYNLYSATVDNQGKLSTMKPIKGDVNTKFHDGPAAYDKTNDMVYFTRNNYLNKKGVDGNNIMRLKIYRAKLVDFKLKNIEELPFNSDNYSCGHPSISADGKQLYFVSDMPGGHGGTDIYSIEVKERNTFGTPVNLGEKINTSRDEVFPYIHPGENILFFSSNGLFGLGGLDIFVAKMTKAGDVKSVQNIGAPINTMYDDFSFVNNAEQTMGFIASNRVDGVGNDDIYRFDQNKAIKSSSILNGNVFDLLTSTELGDAVVKIVNKAGEVVDSVVSSSKGKFNVDLVDIDDDFTLVVSKDNYIVSTTVISYAEDKEEYNEKVSLMPVIDYHFAGLIKDKESNQPLDNVSIKITDLNTGIVFAELKNNEAGDFITDKINYFYDDPISFGFVIGREGYTTKTITVQEMLSLKPEIFVDEALSKVSTNNVEKIEPTIIKEGTNLAVALNLNPIYFDLNSSYLRPDAKIELDKIVSILNQNPQMEIDLSAHTDCRESKKYNIWLSDRRAKRSAEYIRQRISNPSRIKNVQGFGESRLLNDCGCEENVVSECTEEQHQLNRRTEFIVVKL